MFVKGTVSQFFTMVLFCAFVYVMIQRAKAGLRVPAIRKIPGLEAVDEAIGRATEMGRPVRFAPGIGHHQRGNVRGRAFLGHVAKLCARYDTRLINTNRDYLVHAINEN